MPRTSGGPVPSGTGTISKITSVDSSVTITDPEGPTTDLSVAAGGITTITSTGATVTITDPTGPSVNVEVAHPAPTASSTVTGPDAFGASSAAGTATTFSKGDHNHGLPAAPADLPLAGGTMSGVIAMGSNKITGLANGASAQDAAAFGQIPTVSGVYLPLAGGTMSGAIAMGASKITGLANGTASTDAAAFGQIPPATIAAQYAPGTPASYNLTATSLTVVDNSAGHLTIAFTVGASGNVIISSTFTIANNSGATTDATLNFGWLNHSGGAQVGMTEGGAQFFGASTLSVIKQRVTIRQLLTGLTAGALQLDLAYTSSSASNAWIMFADTNAVSANGGPVIMTAQPL